MTRMLYSLYALILLIALFAQYLPVSIATSKYHPKNSNSEHSISESKSLSLNRFKKCESSWWNNRKSLQKWSKGREWCINDSKYHSSRNSGKEIWSNWENYSQCRCESLDWDIRNPAGIFVCYQIAWFNKVTGKFVGELSVYQLSSRNKYKEERSHVAFKFSDFKVKVHKKSHLKRDSSGYYHGISPKFARKQDESIIQKFYVHGKISKNELIHEKILVDLLSPSEYKVIVGSKEFKFMKNHDAVNLPFSNYLPNNPFYPVVDNCPPYPPKGGKGNTMPNDTPSKNNDTSNKDNPNNTPSKDNPVATPTDIPGGGTPSGTSPSDNTSAANPTNPNEVPSKPPTNTNPDIVAPNPDVEATPSPVVPINTGSSSTPVNSPADSSSDSSTNSSSKTSQNTVNSADQDSSTPSSSSSLPGASLGVVPIGLAIFGAIIIIAIIFVLYSRYQSGKWTKKYRRRQAVRSENLANAPGFNVGNNGSNA